MALYALLGICAAALEAILAAMLHLGDLKAYAVEYISLALGASLLYLTSVWIILRIPPSRRLLGFVFTMGLIFRATLVPLYPSLSDDLLRYRWEGKAQAAGLNPYRVAPIDTEARGLRDSTWPAVNGKPFPALYGPLTELIYRLSYRASGGPVLWMKAPAVLFDVGTAVLLALLLISMKLPATRVLIYLWSPLAVVEFAASGHNDSIAVFFLLASLLALAAFRPPLSLMMLTLSAASKFFTGLLAPLLIVGEWRCLTQRRGLAFLWPVLIGLAVCWPFRDGIASIVPTVAMMGGHWRNNDGLFGVVAGLTGSLEMAQWVYTLVALGTALVLALRRTAMPRGAYIMIGVTLAFAANCFPWYLTWILPLLAVFVNPAWLLLIALSPLAYHILIGYATLGVWQDSGFYRALEYIPFYALLIGGRFVKRHE